MVGPGGAPAFTAASLGLALPNSIPSLSPFPMRSAFPASEYYGDSAPSGAFSRRCTYPTIRPGWPDSGNRHRTVPMFTVVRSIE